MSKQESQDERQPWKWLREIIGWEINNPNYTSDYPKRLLERLWTRSCHGESWQKKSEKKTDCPKGKERKGFRNGGLTSEKLHYTVNCKKS